MMNKAKITSISLMDDASAYSINLKNMGNWKTEISRNMQIVALTTQITALETKVTNLSSAKAPTGHSVTPGGATVTPGGTGIKTTLLNFGVSRKLTARLSIT
jgi:hypothetical protein